MPESLLTLPKVELHVHLEGTISPELLIALAHRHGVDLGARRGLPPEELYRFADFQEFLRLFADVCAALREPQDYGVLAAGYARTAAAEGVRYAEVFISPSVWTYFHRDLDVRAGVEEIRAAFDQEERRSGLVVRMIADLTRNFGPERGAQTLALADSLRDLGVVGIGLGGDERRFPARDFTAVFLRAKELGLHTVAHAGEAEAAWSVRDAVELLGAERIGHGVSAVEDPSVVALLLERGVAVEVCPTSNERTGAWRPKTPHPLVALDRAGVPVVIDSDDPALFGTTLINEYARVAEMTSPEAVRRFARNAVARSFADEPLKRTLLASIDAHAGESTDTAKG
ncbi:MAG TPA: adenosine deaminase [Candidatus Dormibacteraeota bacterium]|nr:adenosine deaminase [Candidatus Dormibacteraeota bacterium]